MTNDYVANLVVPGDGAYQPGKFIQVGDYGIIAGSVNGALELARAVNWFYAKRQKPLVAQAFDGDSGNYVVKLTNSLVETNVLYYKIRNLDDSERCTLKLRIYAEATGGGNTGTVRMTTSTGNNTVAVTAKAKYEITQTFDPTADDELITISLDNSADPGTVQIYNLDITLNSHGASGSLSATAANYASGFMPQDPAAWSDESPLSVDMVNDVQAGLDLIWKHHRNTIISYCWPQNLGTGNQTWVGSTGTSDWDRVAEFHWRRDPAQHTHQLLVYLNGITAGYVNPGDEGQAKLYWKSDPGTRVLTSLAQAAVVWGNNWLEEATTLALPKNTILEDKLVLEVLKGSAGNAYVDALCVIEDRIS